jgi:hypothetical protein
MIRVCQYSFTSKHPLDCKRVRDYRAGNRIAKKWSANPGREACVEWYSKGQVTYAVIFQNGKRNSCCSLKGA